MNDNETLDEAPRAADASIAPMEEEGAPGPPFLLEQWVLNAIEALVFSSSEPLSAARARDVIAAEMALMDDMEGKGEPTLADMKAAFSALRDRWSRLAVAEGEAPVLRGFRLVEIDGALCFRTSAAQARFIRRMQMGKPQRLSRASLETLAVVAYRQPVTKPQIEEVRGVDCSGALKALLDKKLIRVLGKAEEIGRPLLYGTTKIFLEFFELESLTDLPTLKELHELEHGLDPHAIIDADDDRPAVIMDLFNADQASSVSEETERESTDAMDALERALVEAKDVAKRASTLVFGMHVEEGDEAGAVAAPPSTTTPETSEAAEEAKDEEPKA
jgi:segregation and condensation protein B